MAKSPLDHKSPKQGSGLFRKILLSFFPNHSLIHAGINPASMFISFISAKQFFSLVNRRMIEHYKINLYDITIDPFDVKTGFGEVPNLNMKNVDFYYSYNSAANMIGHTFMSPNNIATGITMFLSPLVANVMKQRHYKYFKHFIFSIYLLTFIFIARIKVFPPHQTREESHKWFVELFWSFFELIFLKTSNKLSPKIYTQIKKELMHDVRIFFCLYETYKYLNDVFIPTPDNEASLYQWLFVDEIKHKQYGPLIKAYIEEYRNYIHTSTFSKGEAHLMDLLMPADMVIRYVFGNDEAQDIATYLFGNIYDPKETDKLLDSFLINGDRVVEMIEYTLDSSTLKKNFFRAMQQCMKHILNEINDYTSVEDSINDFLSSIEDDPSEGMSIIGSIPESLKIESALMERMVNFYTSLMGGLWIARGDSMALRIRKRDLGNAIITQCSDIGNKAESLHFYGSLFYLYLKNAFYYKKAFENIRAGKDNFAIPLVSEVDNNYSNIFVVKMFHESFVYTLLQDLNTNEIKLSIKRLEIIDAFKSLYSGDISTLIKRKGKDFIKGVYGPYDALRQTDRSLSQIMQKHLNDDDINILRERLYTFDFWIGQEVINIFSQIESLHKLYDTSAIMGMMSIMRDSLMGFILYYCYIRFMEDSHQKKYHSDDLITIYISQLLHIQHPDMISSIGNAVCTLIDRSHTLLTQWINIDDNDQYLYIGLANWITRCEDKTGTEIISKLSGDDIVWFGGYLKNITYYNRRYIIPQINK